MLQQWYISHRLVLQQWYISHRLVLQQWYISHRLVLQQWYISHRLVLQQWYIGHYMLLHQWYTFCNINSIQSLFVVIAITTIQITACCNSKHSLQLTTYYNSRNNGMQETTGCDSDSNAPITMVFRTLHVVTAIAMLQSQW